MKSGWPHSEKIILTNYIKLYKIQLKAGDVMNPRGETIAILKANGYKLKTNRKGSRHDLYYNDELKSRIAVSRSSHFDDNDKRMILNEITKAKRR